MMTREEAIKRGKEFISLMELCFKDAISIMPEEGHPFTLEIEDVNEILDTDYHINDVIKLLILVKLLYPEILAMMLNISEILNNKRLEEKDQVIN